MYHQLCRVFCFLGLIGLTNKQPEVKPDASSKIAISAIPQLNKELRSEFNRLFHSVVIGVTLESIDATTAEHISASSTVVLRYLHRLVGYLNIAISVRRQLESGNFYTCIVENFDLK